MEELLMEQLDGDVETLKMLSNTVTNNVQLLLTRQYAVAFLTAGKTMISNNRVKLQVGR
jgi:hypothetical protein